MIPLSELRVIEDTFLSSSLVYYKPSIYKLLNTHFKEENIYSDATLVKLKNLVKVNNVMAYNTILQEDIKKLRSGVKKTPIQFDETLWRDILPKIRNAVKKTLGLDFKTRSVFFENHFPRGLIGFEKKGASSVTIFEGNKDAGIYFLNKRVSSFFTPLLLIHEQLHSCLSQNKSKEQMYIEWFEEGLCMWYSMKIFNDLTKNINVLKYYKERCYIYSKVKDEHNFTRRYYEYMKIFSRLFLAGGDKLIGKMLISYLGNKRDTVNKYLNLDALTIENNPKTKIEHFLTTFAEEIEPEKVPPVEYLVLRESLHPNLLETLSEKIQVPEDFLRKVIINLNFKGMLIVKNQHVEMNWRKRDLFERGLIKPFWPLKDGSHQKNRVTNV